MSNPPVTISDAMMVLVSFGQLRNNLIEIDEEGEPTPELAESWEASADAVMWRFQLRKSFEFH